MPLISFQAGCFKVLRLMLENEKWLEAAAGTLEEKARLDQSQATFTLFASLLSQLDSESEARGDKSSKSKPTAMRIANALSSLWYSRNLLVLSNAYLLHISLDSLAAMVTCFTFAMFLRRAPFALRYDIVKESLTNTSSRQSSRFWCAFSFSFLLLR